MGLKGDEGARRLIGALNADELAEVQASGLGVTFDVDTAEDLAIARRHQGGGP
jgi:CTP:molybdopterin cytidylyltransferase MocA